MLDERSELSSRPEAPSPEALWPPPGNVSVYVADPESSSRSLIAGALSERGFMVREIRTPDEAFAAIRGACPQVLVTEWDRNGLDGFELARLALEEDPDTVVIIMTADSDAESAAQAFRLGVADYHMKPPNPGALLDTIERALARRAQQVFHRDAEAWLRKEVEARTRELEDKTALLEKVTVGALSALVRTLEQRTPHFRGHSNAVGELSERIAAALGLSGEEVDACRTAGFLHDIGMIAIPDRILEKAQSLTREESQRLRGHCRIGREILEPFPHLGPVPDYIYLHHERIDGSGYPDGLKGAEIPLGAQVVAVADSFRALIEERPYRPAHSAAEAVDILIGTAGIWHSPDVLKAMARVVPAVAT